MRKATTLGGTLDTADIPQEPRKIIAPVPGDRPAALAYYVTTTQSTKSLFRGDVTACTDWAQREAVARSAPLDVRESTTGEVFFGFDTKGKFC